jgi:hypothetical protein
VYSYRVTRIAHLALCGAAIVLSTVSVSAASDPKTEVVACVSGEMAAFSNADRAAFVASYVDVPSILDDVAPYAWNDAGGWFDAVRPLFQIVTMTPGAPTEVLVDGRHAFVLLPFKIEGNGVKGKHFQASGYWSGALVQSNGPWRIASAAITLTQ